MPPQEPTWPTDQLDQMTIRGAQRTMYEHIGDRTTRTTYSREQLLYYSKCFAASSPKPLTPLRLLTFAPSALLRYGVVFPVRLSILTASTIAFFTSLPIALAFDSKTWVSRLVQYYCKGILFSLGVVPQYCGEKPFLKEPHVFVSNHTSYLDYIILSAHKYPGAVVMARHGGALGFLQNNGLNYLNSMTFDRSNLEERKVLAQRLKQHVLNPNTWPNPMIIFPEGTCVNNQYTIRFQKGAFEMGVKICPVGIHYDRYWGDPYWDTRKGFLSYAFYRMTRWISPVKVVYLTPEKAQHDEDAASFGNRIKNSITQAIGVHNEDFNGMAKRDLLEALKT